VAKTSFWIWHLSGSSLLLLSVKRIFAQVGIELHQLKSIRGITLIFGGRVIAFPILGTHDSDNFSNFAFFLRHGTNLLTRCYAPGRTYIMVKRRIVLQRVNVGICPGLLIGTCNQAIFRVSFAAN
jgi:hypothetical protein